MLRFFHGRAEFLVSKFSRAKIWLWLQFWSLSIYIDPEMLFENSFGVASGHLFYTLEGWVAFEYEKNISQYLTSSLQFLFLLSRTVFYQIMDPDQLVHLEEQFSGS